MRGRTAIFEQFGNWIGSNGNWLGWLAGVSALTFVLSLALLPWLVARIPVDYFSTRRRHPSRTRELHPLLYLLLRLGKNLLGWLLLLAGAIMLVTPGQGLLTLLLGLSLCDFPGKYKLERAIVRRPAVFEGINWLRRRRGVVPLQHPDGAVGASSEVE